MSDAETAGAASPVTRATHASLTAGTGTEPSGTAVRSRPARFPEERQEAVGGRRRLPAQRALGAKMAPRCARAGIAPSFPFSFPFPPPLPPPAEPGQAPPCRSARPSGWASSHRRNPRPPGRSEANSGAARTGRAGPHRGRRGAGGSAGSATPRWRSPPRGPLPATWRAGERTGRNGGGRRAKRSGRAGAALAGSDGDCGWRARPRHKGSGAGPRATLRPPEAGPRGPQGARSGAGRPA